MAGRTKVDASHHRKKAFLQAFAVCGNISKAAEMANIDRSTHYIWLRDDPSYAEAFAQAEEQAVDALEQEARRRALEGTLRPVYQGGKLVGEVREFSDTLLIFLLKGARPHKYRDRAEISGPTGGAIEIRVQLPDELATEKEKK